MADISLLSPSELRILNLLWQHGELRAAQLANHLKDTIGWNRNTTYTVAKKCVAKGFVQRREPFFHCRALITPQQVRAYAVAAVARTLYGGDFSLLLAEVAQAGGFPPPPTA